MSDIFCTSCSGLSWRRGETLGGFSSVSVVCWWLMTGWRHQVTPHLCGVRASLCERALVLFVQSIHGPACQSGCVLLQPRGEHGGEWRGGGCRRCGWPQCAAPTALTRPARAGARAETVCGHTQGATGALVDPATASGQDCAATPAVLWAETSPGRTRRVCRPCRPREAPRGEDERERESVSPRH
jgi:hypothetical protein